MLLLLWLQDGGVRNTLHTDSESIFGIFTYPSYPRIGVDFSEAQLITITWIYKISALLLTLIKNIIASNRDDCCTQSPNQTFWPSAVHFLKLEICECRSRFTFTDKALCLDRPAIHWNIYLLTIFNIGLLFDIA